MHEIALLTRLNPGWNLTEIRALTVRERQNWLAFAEWIVRSKRG
jgi:hypothetical protein